MNSNFQLNTTQLNRLFPFYIIIDSKLEIKNFGDSAGKLFKLIKNDYVHNHFFVSRPKFDLSNFNEIITNCNQLVILENINNGIKFRGQFEYLEYTNTILFIGSPWFVTMEAVTSSNLKIKDFAHHDPLIDLLHLLQAQEISNQDLKKLVNTINDQKTALNLKNKEIHDIALFPMQNPDPLLRINFNGDILRNNPAAALLDFFEYENKIWRIDNFLKEIANKINIQEGRLVFEAVSNNKTYSLMCVPMVKEGYINIYGRNITERKIIEEKLEEQRKFYEDILNNMPADIAVFNKQHQYLFVNPKAIKNSDVRNWIIGKTDHDYCIEKQKPLTIADNRNKLFNNVIENKAPLEWEEKIIKNNNEEEIVLRRWFPVIDDNNDVKIVIGYGLDITERKKSEEALKINEEKYRSIIANMNLGLMEIDNKGVIEFVNQSIQKMTGLSNAQLIGKNADIFLTPNHLNKKTNTLINDAFEIETTINGKQDWWLVSAAPQITPNGKNNGAIIVCLDITKQKKLEKELIKSRKEAEELAKTKENFLANMSHEIRTPMNAIMGLGSQLAKTPLTNKQQFYVKTINNASENLLYIINDILDLSKIEAGKLNIEQIAFEPQKTFTQTLQMLLYKAEEKGLNLINSTNNNLIAEVLIGDPYRLNQILLNLLSNAIKFTEKGSVNLKVEVVNNNEHLQVLQFSIIDTGIGMEDNFVEILFEKFTQEYEAVSRKYGGTGLGMSICKQLINLMGGEINVYSQKNYGTTISFSLPFKKGSKLDLIDYKISTQENSLLNGIKVVVADDNEMNRLVAKTILENHNVQIIEAANGQEALNYIINNKPDVVLMDIQMPILNGYEATKKIRNAGFNFPIIALTANAIKGEKEKCLEAGMDDFITKPFNEEEFINCIVRNIQNNALNKEVIQENNLQPLYNLSTLKNIGNGNTVFLEKMIKLFIDIAPKTVDEIKAASKKNDIEAVNKLSHRLKPSIDNLLIYSLKNVIRNLEHFDLANNDTVYLNELIAELDSIIIKVVESLTKEFNL